MRVLLSLTALLLASAPALAQDTEKPAPVPPAEMQAPEPDPEAEQSGRYDSCINQVELNPRAAIGVAEAWENAGGGLPAGHCKALALLYSGEEEKAATLLVALAFSKPEPDIDLRADLLAQAGNAYLMAGRAAAAREALTNALGLRPDDPDLLIDRARAAAMEKNWPSAIADLSRAYEIAPARADILVLRASARKESGDARGAKVDLDAALDLAPNSTQALFDRARLYLASGNLEKARADFLAVETAAPGTALADASKREIEALDAR